MQLFNSATRIRKEHRSKLSTREPQGVQLLLGPMHSGGIRRAGGAIIAFTSANPGEGVSHVVQFFAEKLASQTGKPTLVVNADQLGSLRVTDFMHMPGVRTKVGNSWPATDEASGNGNGRGNGNGNGHGNGTVQAPDFDNLPQLESETGIELLRSIGANFDYALIDCPSVSTSYDAAMLAPAVDGVVLVVEADRTKRDQIFRARQTIEMAKGNLMGLVLNRRRLVVPEWFYRRL